MKKFTKTTLRRSLALILILSLLFIIPINTSASYQKGDINGDGKINGMDLLLLKQHILNVPGKTIESGTTAFDSADMNSDGKINGMDLLLLKKAILSDTPNTAKGSYFIYYGELNDEIIKTAMGYELVILHPVSGKTTRAQVQKIRSSGAKVLGYISIGEDLRTAWMTPEQMLSDKRFTGDGTGPRVDPRADSDGSLDNVDIKGKTSPGGTGYASYYLDDNNFDGKPDINVNFNCAFTNIGDPKWFDELDKMTFDGIDKIAGIREILTDDYGRGLGCDGLFLDTLDTAAPNSYTSDSDAHKTRFEWTAAGVPAFLERLTTKYPDKLVLQNRGMFFFHHGLPHYKVTTGKYIDFLLVESYMLDSNPNWLYHENYFADNKYVYTPKIMAEANRPNGFEVLSLGYAEGPPQYKLKDTLLGKSDVGMAILKEDIYEAEIVGYKHYITDGGLVLPNDFVKKHEDKNDTLPPVWSSVYNDSPTWPPRAPNPRIGIGQAVFLNGNVTVRWDVALDQNKIVYTLYYQTSPFDFTADPNLLNAEKLELTPSVGEGYANGPGENIYPYEAVITGLNKGNTYYFVIRARDNSANRNEEKNIVFKSVDTYIDIG